MALISCPKCGKEISDKAEKCPECGCALEYDKLQTEFISEKKTPIKSINKKLLVVAMILCVIILFVVGYSSYKKNELIKRQTAEVESIREYNSYIDSLNTVYADSLNGASNAEDVCVLVHNVWGIQFIVIIQTKKQVNMYQEQVILMKPSIKYMKIVKFKKH